MAWRLYKYFYTKTTRPLVLLDKNRDSIDAVVAERRETTPDCRGPVGLGVLIFDSAKFHL